MDADSISVIELEPGDRVMVCGDWHGNIAWARNCLWYANRKGCRALVQVGDFGFWIDSDETQFYLDEVEREANEWGTPVYWLDGNHEDHSRRAEFNSDDRPMTTYLPRGYRWDWWGKRFMAVGGAVSVDKRDRQEGISWWPEETLSDEEVGYASRFDGTPVDVVLAHDCPRGVDIPGVGPDNKNAVRGIWPPDALYQADIHRDKMWQVWQHTRPDTWIHGHYHIPYVSYLATGVHEPHTKFIGLGSDGDRMTSTVTTLSFDSGVNSVVDDGVIY